jgi:hypothetical protein
MKCNVGNTDRLLRVIGGLIVVIAGIIFDNWFGLLGVVLLATGLFKWCPLYLPFGINTNKKDQ